jgi:hypothetical protein
VPVDEPAERDVPPVAWAFWDGWRGPPELVVHVVRRALWAVELTDAEHATAECKVDVYVKDDVEPIQRFDAFATDVTDDALRNFSVIAIDVRGPRGRVNVDLARKPHAELGPPRSGVLVVVSNSSVAVEVREVVARTLERRTGRRKRYSGETATEAEVRDAVAAAAPPEPVGGRVTKAVAGAIAAAAGGLATGFGGEEPVRASDLISLLAIAVAGGVLWVVAVLLIPSVEVQAVTRARRAADLAYKGVGAALVTRGHRRRRQARVRWRRDVSEAPDTRRPDRQTWTPCVWA